MTTDTTKVARGTSAFFGQSVTSGLLRIFNIMILTRLLLQNQIGQIALIGIVYGFIQFLGALGLNHAAPLVVSEAEERKQYGIIRTFLSRSLILIIFSSIFLVVLLYIFSPLLVVNDLLSVETVQVLMIIGLFSSLEVFLDSFLLARYTVRNLATGRILFDSTRVILSVGLVFAGVGVTGVAIGWLIAEIFAVFYYGYFASRKLPSNTQSDVEFRPIIAFALSSLVFQGIDVAIQNTDRLILLYQSDLVALGVYDVMLSILFMMSFVSLAISTSLYPVFTKARVRSETEKSDHLGNAIGYTIRYILALLIPLAIIAALNANAILTHVFSASYATYPNACLSFSILVVSYVAWGIVYALHVILRSLGEARFFVLSGLAIFGFEIVGAWYLTSWFGLLGSALIRACYIHLLLIASIWRLRQKQVHVQVNLQKRLARILLASIIAGLLVLVLHPASLLELGLFGILSLIVYFGLLVIGREIIHFDIRVAKAIFPLSFHTAIGRFERYYFSEKEATLVMDSSSP
ncbi:MAG: oligosaccharide flippase family protein [Candidatus Lokiarchaeota archaeon]|nr:oligosaccharide flippase family protein [Candidatus Lokiarchaeota archaeon]